MVSSSHLEKDFVFRVVGMDCGEEVSVLKRELSPLVGGEELLRFDVLNGKLIVSSEAEVTEDAIREAVHRTGMRAVPWVDARKTSKQPQTIDLRPLATIVSAVFIASGFGLHVGLSGSFAAALGAEGLGSGHDVPLESRILYLLAVIAGGWFIAPKAVFALKRLRPDMNLLMTIAVFGAIGIGEWFEAATVTFLFALSFVLENWSVGRARRAVEALLDLAPSTVRVRYAGEEVQVSPDSVKVDSLFVVHPGERFPLDGTVVSGSSGVDQSSITGESLPVLKKPEDDIFAGTINGDGVLEVRSTHLASDSTIARIIRLVEDAQSHRAPAEQWVERFAAIYTPVVMVVALIVLIIPPLVTGAAWDVWIYRSLVLLVIACPCALVISTPVTIVASLASSAREGVLIKGGSFVELPSRLRAIALDKTGTLTEGRPAVVEVLPLGDHDEREVIERAAALESRSSHPLAEAVLRYARSKGIKVEPGSDLKNLPGRGMMGVHKEKFVWLGSHRYLEERGQQTEHLAEQLARMSAAGRTVVVVGNATHVCGLVGIADELRTEAVGSLEMLRRDGIEHLVMLTGDNQATADAIALETGIDEVHAGLLPEDKVEMVKKLVEKYGFVAMVGDGVNDAPAMASASMGIAMGSAGSDAAIESSDVALMSDDLARLPWLVRHSRRTMTVIRQNITFALGVKAIVVVLTAMGVATLWMAIAADMGASLLVITNGMRLLIPRPR